MAACPLAAVGSYAETSPERRVHALAGDIGERPPSRSIHDRVKLFTAKKNALVGELSVTVVHDDPEETTAVSFDAGTKLEAQVAHSELLLARIGGRVPDDGDADADDDRGGADNVGSSNANATAAALDAAHAKGERVADVHRTSGVRVEGDGVGPREARGLRIPAPRLGELTIALGRLIPPYWCSAHPLVIIGASGALLDRRLAVIWNVANAPLEDFT